MDNKDWVKRFTWMAVAALAFMLIYSAIFGGGGHRLAHSDPVVVSPWGAESVVG